jgi:uncharacterized protein
MGAFLCLTALEGFLPKGPGNHHPLWYPAIYAVKAIAVAVTAVICRSSWCDFRPRPSWAILVFSAVLGFMVTVMWVGLDGHYPAISLRGLRANFDPRVLSPPALTAFLAVRFLGLVVLVPAIEELFWRSFLIRWIINPRFERVPLGRVTPAAAAISAVVFALAHPEWLPALITGLLWAGLLRYTRSLSACLVSHAVANLTLYLYVLGTGNWRFW